MGGDGGGGGGGEGDGGRGEGDEDDGEISGGGGDGGGGKLSIIISSMEFSTLAMVIVDVKVSPVIINESVVASIFNA